MKHTCLTLALTLSETRNPNVQATEMIWGRFKRHHL